MPFASSDVITAFVNTPVVTSSPSASLSTMCQAVGALPASLDFEDNVTADSLVDNAHDLLFLRQCDFVSSLVGTSSSRNERDCY
eukprot:5606156-Amphidinium_carterae.1